MLCNYCINVLKRKVLGLGIAKRVLLSSVPTFDYEQYVRVCLSVGTSILFHFTQHMQAEGAPGVSNGPFWLLFPQSNSLKPINNVAINQAIGTVTLSLFHETS